VARLPSYGYLIQQIDGIVILFEDGSEREIVRYSAGDQDATARAQKTIYDSELSPEDKCYAHFWAGYFWAHAGGAEALLDAGNVIALMEALSRAMAEHSTVLSGPAWEAYDRLRRQIMREGES
jgi:hypothetical protein